MRGQFRHGMARRPAEWLPIHARDGALRRIYRGIAEGLAGTGRSQVERKMDHGRGCGCGRDESFDPNKQGVRRLHCGLPHEWRDAASRTGLSRATRCSGLGRQRLGQMAASPQGRRSAMVHTRGNLEIYGPARERQGTKIYVRDGREIRHHLAIAADTGEAKRVQRYFGTSLVRTRQNQARRYFTRWWPKLAYGTGRWARFGQGVRPFLLRIRYWNGEELLVQSRAMDETGYVQPSKDALRKIRGVNSIYHNNGIQTWALKPGGEVENVEVG